MLPEFRIYYGNGYVVRGYTRADWQHAPSDDVQVVVLMAPYPDGRRPWRGVDDRQLWTGDDSFDPFGWGAKLGRLIASEQYERIWERACGDS